MIRKGMWCVNSEGAVGIANAIGAKVLRDFAMVFDESLVEFHNVADNGETVTVTYEPIDTLTQARLRDIPPARRGNRASKVLAAMGYL